MQGFVQLLIPEQDTNCAAISCGKTGLSVQLQSVPNRDLYHVALQCHGPAILALVYKKAMDCFAFVVHVKNVSHDYEKTVFLLLTSFAPYPCTLHKSYVRFMLRAHMCIVINHHSICAFFLVRMSRNPW